MSRFIVSIATLALLGAGCAAPPAPQPQTSMPPAEIEKTGLIVGTVISMGPQGFNPPTLTVAKDTEIIFLNEDAGSPHWPASTPHPIHTDYPGFDAKTTIQPGESWSFTFDRVGTWRYHDHLNPSRTGTVVVTE